MRTHVLPNIVLVMVFIIGSLLAPGPAYAGAHSPVASHPDETPPFDSPVDLAHQHHAAFTRASKVGQHTARNRW